MVMASPDNKKADLKIGFFVTGTDTDVGKTFFTACLAYSLSHAGHKVAPRKPIASGCILQTDGSLLSEDALQLQSAAGNIEPLESICPNCFEPPISPHQALLQAGKTITTRQLAHACQTPSGHIKLVEGAGGWYSPLSSDGLNADLAVELQLPVILVAANRLGCINQILLSQEAVLNRGLKLAAIVINQIEPGTNYAADIDDYVQAPLVSLPHQKSGQPLFLEQLAALVKEA
ncbi:dethiobiotin synthase [Thiomicrorhabdus heinhorstiae]|uniref:ATP-dependent dethiobiotin synthetase BioD n=1 Tax=Thiomicrorhabdus heinhorstiae TaxID=2748010 RepID=A0ABS0BWH4_9GAMM|nr:dethiobiotin synthase [Thiomicrorhabdus heinhorstiae]MBF6058155.1 dethiobiotin synthase [Thiomicrorhabdus heinhorstiae]